MMMASRVSLNLPLPRPDLKSEKLESLGNVHDPGFLPLWESMWYLDRRVGRCARRYWRVIYFSRISRSDREAYAVKGFAGVGLRCQ
jgi:hypothetical protein